MPTFASIDLHPELRQRIVSIPKPKSQSLHQPHQQQQRPPQPIRTPQSLLSRNPATLHLLDSSSTSTSRPIALEQAQKLRVDVARALVNQTNTGHYIRRVQQKSAVTATEATALKDHGDSPRKRQSHVLKHKRSVSLEIPGTVSALELWQYHASVHGTTAAGAMTATDIVSTGCRALDDMLAWAPTLGDHSTAGLAFGYVTQFAGPPASGKTQLALHVAVTNGRSSIQTWYICSGSAGPMAHRLADMCHATPEILRDVIFCPASNDHDVLRHLAALESHLTNNATAARTILVLDSCSGCLNTATLPKRGFKRSNDSLLLTVAATVRRLTRYHNLATILLNGTVSNREFAPTASHDATTTLPTTVRPNKPALGRRWNLAVADICVWLESSAHTPQLIHATLDRHVGRPHGCGQHVASFVIAANGIQDAPPPSNHLEEW